VECRRSLGALEEHIASLGAHLQVVPVRKTPDASDITLEDVSRWMTKLGSMVLRSPPGSTEL